MPENDQTRWVGVRPVNPPEDIPVTLDGEVAHVIVDSGAVGDSSAGKLKVGHHYQDPTVAGTWYTILDITNKGYLLSLGIVDYDNAVHHCDLRVTVDGDTPDILSGVEYSGTFGADRGGVANTTATIPLGLRFNTSLKVEMRSSDAGHDIRGACFYTIDH